MFVISIITKHTKVYLGDSIAGVTPLPIPNREVKTCGADGTACVGAWESKSLPGVLYKSPTKLFLVGLFASITDMKWKQTLKDATTFKLLKKNGAIIFVFGGLFVV